MSKYDLRQFPGDVELARAAAGDWLSLVARSPGGHLAAFSGGRIAKTFFSAVAQQAKKSGVSLKSVDFFWADERCVPPGDPESNYRLARENLLEPLSILPEKIHRLKGELPQEAAVAEANAVIGRIAPKNSAGLPVLDVIFLGLGENAHIASLMPDAPPAVTESKSAYVRIENSPKPPPNRISLSYAAIAAAKNVWMLAAGDGKEEALRQSLRPDSSTPFGRVLRSRPQTVIYSDIAI
jgi:6-phosphogluconolactonase